MLGADDGTLTEWDVGAAHRTRCYAPHAAALTGLALTAGGGGGGGGGATAAAVTVNPNPHPHGDPNPNPNPNPNQGGHDGTLSVWAWQPEVSSTGEVRSGCSHEAQA